MRMCGMGNDGAKMPGRPEKYAARMKEQRRDNRKQQLSFLTVVL